MALAFDDIRLLVSLRHKRNLDPVARSLVPSVAQATESEILACTCSNRRPEAVSLPRILK